MKRQKILKIANYLFSTDLNAIVFDEGITSSEETAAILTEIVNLCNKELDKIKNMNDNSDWI